MALVRLESSSWPSVFFSSDETIKFFFARKCLTFTISTLPGVRMMTFVLSCISPKLHHQQTNNIVKFNFDMIVNRIPSGVSFELVLLELRHSCNTKSIVAE